MMVCYHIDFSVIIKHELHERAFGDMDIFPFPCLVQILHNEASVSEVLSVDARVEVTSMARASMIKDPTNSFLA